MKEHKHLNIIERKKIAVFKAKGHSHREIGRRLNCSYTAIRREVLKFKCKKKKSNFDKRG